MTPKLLASGLTGRVYIVTRYRERANGGFEAQTKYDVTDEFMATATAALSRRLADSLEAWAQKHLSPDSPALEELNDTLAAALGLVEGETR